MSKKVSDVWSIIYHMKLFSAYDIGDPWTNKLAWAVDGPVDGPWLQRYHKQILSATIKMDICISNTWWNKTRIFLRTNENMSHIIWHFILQQLLGPNSKGGHIIIVSRTLQCIWKFSSRARRKSSHNVCTYEDFIMIRG